MNIIETSLLTKRFGDVTAVDQVSMHVGKGEIYGLLGLNGAGKTTLIRMLLGMIRPDAGDTLLFGGKLNRESGIWNEIGYLVETPHSYPDLTATENLRVIYKLRGLTDKSLIGNVIGAMQLEKYQDVKEKHLSLGNKQRLGLAKALIHRPKLLILDEPINGLDPAGIVEIRGFLKDLVRHHGTTIFLSSHILSEIAKLATRIGIVHNGKLIKEINTHELDQQILKKLVVDTGDNPTAIEVLRKGGIADISHETSHIEILGRRAIEEPEKVATLLVKEGIPPRSLHVVEEDLEAFFLRMISETTN
jgi:ABC-2 type transport system ATP-binding protein